MQWSGSKASLLKRAGRTEDADTSGRLFGIRSYLHSFYASADPEDEDDGTENGPFARKVKPKTYDFVVQDDDEPEDNEEDGEPEAENQASGLAALPAKCKRFRRSGTRKLRDSVRRSKEYVHGLRDKLDELNDKRRPSQCLACLNQATISIAIASLLLAFIGSIVLCTVSGKQTVRHSSDDN
jgi:hypothetical protein